MAVVKEAGKEEGGGGYRSRTKDEKKKRTGGTRSCPFHHPGHHHHRSYSHVHLCVPSLFYLATSLGNRRNVGCTYVYTPDHFCPMAVHSALLDMATATHNQSRSSRLNLVMMAHISK